LRSRREIVVRNQSTVPAEYGVVRLESDRSPVFEVTPSGGVIPPQSEVGLKIRYNPCVSGTYTEENYEIRTPGGNTESLTFSARCTPPVVTISKKEDPFAAGFGVPNSINFRDAHVGKTISRVLLLRNDSALPAAYCFCAEKDGIFAFSQTRGVIPANFEASILLSFTPGHPQNFYKRVFCLVENAAPQFLDLLGSGYIDARGEVKEQRPAPIRHAHIQAFRNRVAAGLGKIGPGELEVMYERERKQTHGDLRWERVAGPGVAGGTKQGPAASACCWIFFITPPPLLFGPPPPPPPPHPRDSPFFLTGTSRTR
jgi:hypothetical protein